jgi:hypothetical protein
VQAQNMAGQAKCRQKSGKAKNTQKQPFWASRNGLDGEKEGKSMANPNGAFNQHLIVRVAV